MKKARLMFYVIFGLSISIVVLISQSCSRETCTGAVEEPRFIFSKHRLLDSLELKVNVVTPAGNANLIGILDTIKGNGDTLEHGLNMNAPFMDFIIEHSAGKDSIRISYTTVPDYERECGYTLKLETISLTDFSSGGNHFQYAVSRGGNSGAFFSNNWEFNSVSIYP